MKARLVAVGERPPAWVAHGFAEYRKRLSHWLPLELVEVTPGLRGKGRDALRATHDEGQRVLAALPRDVHVVALDGRGRASGAGCRCRCECCRRARRQCARNACPTQSAG